MGLRLRLTHVCYPSPQGLSQSSCSSVLTPGPSPLVQPCEGGAGSVHASLLAPGPPASLQAGSWPGEAPAEPVRPGGAGGEPRVSEGPEAKYCAVPGRQFPMKPGIGGHSQTTSLICCGGVIPPGSEWRLGSTWTRDFCLYYLFPLPPGIWKTEGSLG